MGFRLLRLLLDGHRLPALVELHDAKTLRIVDVVAENRSDTLLRPRHGAAQPCRQPASIKNVVSEHEGARSSTGKLLTDDERLGKAVRRRLLGVAQ